MAKAITVPVGLPSKFNDEPGNPRIAERVAELARASGQSDAAVQAIAVA